MAWEVREGDAVERLRELADGSVDAIVTDPPYGLEFMGKDWDRLDAVSGGASFAATGYTDGVRLARPSFTGSPNPPCANCGGTLRGRDRKGFRVCRCDAPSFPNHRASQGRAMQDWHEAWAREALRVLRPGGHLLAFGGTRTYHRLACAVEDAGFEIRDEVLSIFEATDAGRQFLASLGPEQIAALDKLGGGPLAWLYGSGFPKSLDVSKAIDKAAGVEREVVSEGKPVKRMIPGADQNATGSWIKDNGREFVPMTTAPATPKAAEWDGWGTALKPAHEPIVVARKPLVGTVAANVLEHGTGAVNVDGCRVGSAGVADESESKGKNRHADFGSGARDNKVYGEDLRARGEHGNYDPPGRWPANVVLSHAEERRFDGELAEVWACVPGCAVRMLDDQAGQLSAGGYPAARSENAIYGAVSGGNDGPRRMGGAGGASRFFYCAKASKAERDAGLDARNLHPTVKPIELMRWLVRLVTPPDGLVLDPFVGSGSTGCAAVLEGFRFVGVERDREYVAIARARIEFWAAHPTELPVEVALAADAARRRVREGGQLGLL